MNHTSFPHRSPLAPLESQENERPPSELKTENLKLKTPPGPPRLRASAVNSALAVTCALLTACATHHHHHYQKPPEPSPAAVDPETVLVHYYVIPGHEFEFQQTLDRAWAIYTSEGAVLPNPHVVLKETGADGKTRFDEILTWVSHSTPSHASFAIKQVWDAEQALCESRDGHGGIGGGEVELVTPIVRPAPAHH